MKTAMHIAPDTLSLIGNTPLVRLKGPSEESGCEIYGKCEFANPGASVKDRAALFIVRDAEETGQLKPGGTTKVNVIAGNPGSGPDTLCVVDEKFLDLERDELTVTVIGKDAKGQEVTATSRFKHHC